MKHLLALIASFASLSVAFAQDSGAGGEKPTPEKAAEQPKPEEKPALGFPAGRASFGDPLTMTLPESVKTAMRDQGNAITRLGLLFDERGSKDGISLEFDGMRTEIPVVFAAFMGEQCDQELSYKDWLARTGRSVDLTFMVKTMPAKLDNLEVSVEHLHLRGEAEVLQSTYKATDAEVAKAYSVRLRGSKPGINRYRLLVTYKNAKGEITSQQGFSHWLIVQAPPMFEFVTEPTCVATRKQLGKVTALAADATLTSIFLLHGGLSVKDCELRIVRRGSREVNLGGLSPDVRRVVGAELPAAGWEEVGRVKVGAPSPAWLKLVQDEAGFMRLSYTHSLSITSDVLPLKEAWEYHFELRHSSSREPLATWNMNVGLDIAKEADIAGAKLMLTATGLEKALEVPFQRK